MKSFHVIAFTHHSVGIEQIGRYHISQERMDESTVQNINNVVDEFLFLSTCNRVEFWIRSENELDTTFLKTLLSKVYPDWSDSELTESTNLALVYSHFEAVNHVFRVSGSLESLVIGEREILTQIREAGNVSKKLELSGDFIRILMKKTIETGKRVFTETDISLRPVSVVNLAYQKLMDVHVADGSLGLNSRILVVGSGRTNQALTRRMKKHGFNNFTVFNRSEANAKLLAEELSDSSANGHSLKELSSYNKGFDVLIACTASEKTIIDRSVLKSLLNGEKSTSKVVVDLAIPREISDDLVDEFNLKFIGVESLKEIAAENLAYRKKSLTQCELIIAEQLEDFVQKHKVRQVELAMRKVPQQVKEIRKRAMEDVFAEEVNKLDAESKEVLDKVVSFLEKKYMSAPMLMAKEILIKEDVK